MKSRFDAGSPLKLLKSSNTPLLSNKGKREKNWEIKSRFRDEGIRVHLRLQILSTDGDSTPLLNDKTTSRSCNH
jgi:hypothetical protein